MPEWRIQRLRGKFAIAFERNGKRERRTLGTADAGEAERLAPAFYAELTRPSGIRVRDLWAGFELARSGRAVLATMKYTFKALETRFGDIPGDRITVADCRAHTAARLRAGIKPGTIHTELGHLRMVLLWAVEEGLIAAAPRIERPEKPAPRDRYLTREEAMRLLVAAKKPHVKTAIHLLLATAGRVTAVLELTWDRVDFAKRQIHLRDPNDATRRKGRAIVPMTDTLLAVLRETKAGGVSDHVIEWAGEPVASLKRGIRTAAKAAGIDDVSPHVFRHTAAVWMAEGGTPMSEIAQYLGHSNTAVTERVYARFSPDHLRQAASHLEIGIHIVSDTPRKAESN
jgi:integrase